MSKEMIWSADQMEIIASRGSELLVSAAAGSGKTAVLVERIFSKIMDKDNPVDIDRFVVVTFTVAAAAQMKDKIRERIERELKVSKDKKTITRLRTQLRLLPSAHISTVHSFCSYIIGQYFHKIGIDPSLKLGDEVELTLLRKEVVAQLLEREYEEEKEDFIRLADLRILTKNDTPLEEWILSTYDKVMSEPFTDLLLEEWENKATDNITVNIFLKELIDREIHLMTGLKETLNTYKNRFPEMPQKYAEDIVSLSYFVDNILNLSDKLSSGDISYEEAYDEIKTRFDNIDVSGFTKSKPTKDELASIWAVFRPIIDDIFIERDKYFFQSRDEHERDRENQAQTSKTIIRLVRDFADMFREAKADRGVMDFNDLEQYALEILFDKDEVTHQRIRSDAAKELGEYFAEVMIDEYQDSNRVQDTILWAVSKAIEEDGKQPWESLSENRFMVGDVKQSIYKFRNACPELFEEKLEIFSVDGYAAHRRIDLHRNFRSRGSVLDATNAVFEKVMHSDIGGVEYDEAARLECGRQRVDEYEGMTASDKVSVELLSIESGDVKECEARHIAKRIYDMVVGDNPVYVEDGGRLRRVKYRDIVILSRAIKPISSKFLEVFEQEGVPLVSGISQGFTDAREISLMIEFLQIIDNPRQDIPLAGVVLGPLFDIDEEKLSLLRAENKKVDLYDVLIGSEDVEVKRFLDIYDRLRELSFVAPTADLIDAIYEETGVYDIFAALSDGVRRCANLDYLKELAIDYDGGSGYGAHNFVEMLQKVKENQLDMGEASLLGEDEDVVRLMTIHKSKGLEFPVVILAQCLSDSKREDKSRFVFDSELGMATFAYDIPHGIKKHNIFKDIISEKNLSDEKGEALRLLYVAMTRAEEKLIIVGTEKKVSEFDDACDFYSRSRFKNFMEMVMPAVIDVPELFEVKRYAGELEDLGWREKMDDGSADSTETAQAEERSTDKIQDQKEEKTGDSTVIEKFNNFDTTTVYNSEVRKLLEYYEEIVGDEETPIPAKVSVSELKRASIEDTEGTEQFISFTEDDEEPIPKFMRTDESEEISGARYGTIVHQVMAKIDFAGAYDMFYTGEDRKHPTKYNKDDSSAGSIKNKNPNKTDKEKWVKESIDNLVLSERLSAEEAESVPIPSIVKFFETDLGQSMEKAAKVGKLHREQAFTMSKPASEIYSDRTEDTPVLIQGIIDAYFETDDGITLMDYKTDHIAPGDEQRLIDRYHIQMQLYREVLEKSLGKNVTNMILYSFSLGKEIHLQ